MRAAETQHEGSGTTRLHVTPAGPTIDVDGVIDICNAAYLDGLLRRARALGHPIWVDLRRVPFVTAAGLSVLAAFASDVVLVEPSDLTVRELVLTDLLDVFWIERDGARLVAGRGFG